MKKRYKATIDIINHWNWQTTGLVIFIPFTIGWSTEFEKENSLFWVTVLNFEFTWSWEVIKQSKKKK